MPRLSDAQKLFVGGSAVSRIYQGANIAWQPPSTGPTTPPSFVSAGAYATNTFGAGTLSVPAPPTVGSNHIVLLHLYMEPAANAPTNMGTLGFNEITPAAVASDHNLRVFWKRSSGSESNYGLQFPGSNAWVAAIASSYQGCITTGNPIDATNQATGNATSTPPISVTTNGDNRLLVWAGADYGGGVTWSTNMTPFTHQRSGGNLAIATNVLAAMGTSAPFSTAASGTDSKSARLIALIPAA